MSNETTPAGQLSDTALDAVVGSHRRDFGVLGEGGPIGGLLSQGAPQGAPDAADMMSPQHQNLAIEAIAPAVGVAGPRNDAPTPSIVVNSGW